MKNTYRVLFGLMLAVAIMSCRDKAAEKRVAELEARLSQLEGAKSAGTATPSTNPAATATPEEKPAGPLPVIAFETLEHDFGTIREGEKVNYAFKFKNTGEAPLIVQSASPSCGCTVPSWTKDPVAINGGGEVRVEFDSNGKSGIQNKTVTVTSNTWPKQMTLRFKAMVTPKPDGSNGPVK